MKLRHLEIAGMVIIGVLIGVGIALDRHQFGLLIRK